MIGRLRGVGIAVLTVVIAVSGVSAAGPARADAGPSLSIAGSGGLVMRGGYTNLLVAGLQAGTSYRVSSDVAEFRNGVSDFPFTVAANATSFATDFLLSNSVVADRVHLTLVDAADPATPLVTVAEPIRPPSLTVDVKYCPNTFTTVYASSFPAGDYTLKASAGTLPAVVLHVKPGLSARAIDVPVPDDVPSTVTVTAADPATGAALATVNASEMAPPDRLDMLGDLWHAPWLLSCFRADEPVTRTVSAGMKIGGPPTSSAYGYVYSEVDIQPAASSRTVSVTITGLVSHQTITSTVVVPGTTLSAGQSLAGSELDPTAMLATARANGFALVPTFCNGAILARGFHMPTTLVRTLVAGSATRPIAGPTGCHLVLQSDGNLVQYWPSGLAHWMSNTGNRGGVALQLQDDGSLVLRDSAGRAVAYRTDAYIASARSKHAVLLDGLFKQVASSRQLTRAGKRLVYLQRLVGGHWQNALARYGDDEGQLAVSFIQPTPLAYRWVLPADIGYAGAASSPTVR